MAGVKRPDESAITKAGGPLDADYEQRLADEAEAGFDPATLTRQQAGPPSPGHSARLRPGPAPSTSRRAEARDRRPEPTG